MSWISDNVPCVYAGLVRNEYLGPDPVISRDSMQSRYSEDTTIVID